MMLGCMYLTNVAKSFFMTADPRSIACTLMVVERFCPRAANERIKTRRKNKNDLDRFITTNLFYYSTKNKTTMLIPVRLLSTPHDILLHQVIAGRLLHQFCQGKQVL